MTKVLSKASKKNCYALLVERYINNLNYVVIEFYKKNVLIMKLQFGAIIQNKAFEIYDKLIEDNKLKREVVADA